MKKCVIIVLAFFMIYLMFPLAALAYDIYDLVAIAHEYGSRFASRYDMNADGVVDIFDLVYVARQVGGGPRPICP
jgi:hypothetical protein